MICNVYADRWYAEGFKVNYLEISFKFIIAIAIFGSDFFFSSFVFISVVANWFALTPEMTWTLSHNMTSDRDTYVRWSGMRDDYIAWYELKKEKLTFLMRKKWHRQLPAVGFVVAEHSHNAAMQIVTIVFIFLRMHWHVQCGQSFRCTQIIVITIFHLLQFFFDQTHCGNCGSALCSILV